MTATETAIVEEARTWLGTPFRLHQRVRGPRGGVDCIGLIEAVGMALGRIAPGRRNYSLWDRDLADELDARMDRIDPAGVLPGDVLAFTSPGSPHPRHLAIVTGEGLIHTYELVGRVVEHGLSKGWASRIAGAWRFRGAS